MPCPTCSHEMTLIAAGWRWCECCGTVQAEADGGTKVAIETPKLVALCRTFGKLYLGGDRTEAWHRLGIAESISTEGWLA